MIYTVARTCPACGWDRMNLNIAKRGTITLTCLGDVCGAQIWVKSPAAVANLLEALRIPAPWRKKTEGEGGANSDVSRGGARRALAGAPVLEVVSLER